MGIGKDIGTDVEIGMDIGILAPIVDSPLSLSPPPIGEMGGGGPKTLTPVNRGLLTGDPQLELAAVPGLRGLVRLVGDSRGLP